MRTKGKRHRQGAHLVLYGPKAAPTHARLVSRDSGYEVDAHTPECFLLELDYERRVDAMLSPVQRMQDRR